MDEEVIINIEDEGSIDIDIEGTDDVSMSVDDKISIIQPTKHSDLQSLDYQSSGHTGFVPARLNILPQFDRSKNRNFARIYVDNNGNDEKLSLHDMFGLFLRQGSTTPEDMQAGEYIFLEKE